MGYDIHSYIGKKIRRGNGDLLRKISFIIFKEPKILLSPLSNKDTKEIALKLRELVKEVEKEPSKYVKHEIEHPMRSAKTFYSEIDVTLKDIDYIREIADFFDESKGIITEEEYFEFFYPFICECTNELIIEGLNGKKVCKECGKKYSRRQIKKIEKRRIRNQKVLLFRNDDPIGVLKSKLPPKYWIDKKQ
jgi:hypothetical protein